MLNPMLFLRAEWRRLAMLNYEVAPACLEPLPMRASPASAFLATGSPVAVHNGVRLVAPGLDKNPGGL